MTPVDAHTTEQIRRRLGAAWPRVSGTIHQDGDCAACGCTLGAGPVAVSLHESDHAVLTALPSHPNCHVAQYMQGGTVAAPPMSHKHTSLVFGAPAPEKRRLSRRQRAAHADRTRLIPVVLVNPSRDVQIGVITGGRWLTLQHENPHLDGLNEFDGRITGQETPTWGADVHADGTVEVTSPLGVRYSVGTNSAVLDAIATTGSVTVVLTDTVDVDDPTSGGKHTSLRAIVSNADETVLAAVASVGSMPASTSLIAPGAAPHSPPSPGGEVLTTSTGITAAMLDTECTVRAVYASDTAVRLAPIPIPALLVEPIRAVLHAGSATGDMKGDLALRLGMRPVDPTSGPPGHRPFTARHRAGRVELISPDGEVFAAGDLDRFPERWHEGVEIMGPHVMVVYGFAIGCRPPEPGAYFSDSARLAELKESIENGAVLWAAMEFVDET